MGSDLIPFIEVGEQMPDCDLRYRHNSLFIFILIFGFSLPAYCWGPVGHEVVAYIAQDNLSTVAKEELEDLTEYSNSNLLIRHLDLPGISNWADEISEHERPETGPWHYIDLPIRKDITIHDEQDYCPDGDCIIHQLQVFEGILGDPTQPKEKRIEALKFVVHFIGDIHMPLHCANDNDQGGNNKLVNFKGSKIKLHRLWDGLIEIHTDESPRQLATRLEKDITAEKRKEWTELPETTMDKINKIGEGNPLVDTASQLAQYTTETYSVTFNPPEVIPTKSPGSALEENPRAGFYIEPASSGLVSKLVVLTQTWAFESYRIAQETIYKGMGPGRQDYSQKPLPPDYYDKMRPIVDRQLEKAGIRLAFVLNKIFH